MIVKIVGMSGSGKSHLVRDFLRDRCERIEDGDLRWEGRKMPVGTTWRLPSGKTLFVVGHYERPTGGGCDTLKKPMTESYEVAGVDKPLKSLQGTMEIGRRVRKYAAWFRARRVPYTIAEAREAAVEAVEALLL